jgi:heme-degrading monooxygenase HmoA
MFASMRRYRLQPESLAEFTRRVEESFADRIAGQPGFVSYQLIDCGDGDLFSLSIFLERGQAERSRDLARGWTDEHLADIEHTRFDAVHGESLVSRAAPGMLEPAHARRSASIRLYRLGSGSVGELLERVDAVFADRLQSMDGFEAAHLLDCGDDEVLWVSYLRDGDAVGEAEDRAVQFMRSELAAFRPALVAAIHGQVTVSRADAALLEPVNAH